MITQLKNLLKKYNKIFFNRIVLIMKLYNQGYTLIVVFFFVVQSKKVVQCNLFLKKNLIGNGQPKLESLGQPKPGGRPCLCGDDEDF